MFVFSFVPQVRPHRLAADEEVGRQGGQHPRRADRQRGRVHRLPHPHDPSQCQEAHGVSSRPNNTVLGAHNPSLFSELSKTRTSRLYTGDMFRQVYFFNIRIIT